MPEKKVVIDNLAILNRIMHTDLLYADGFRKLQHDLLMI